MSALKSLALLVAIVGLASLASCASYEQEMALFHKIVKSPDYTPLSLSEVLRSKFQGVNWLSDVREVYGADRPNKALELLNKLDRIDKSREISEQLEVIETSADQFCIKENLNELDELAAQYYSLFQKGFEGYGDNAARYRRSIGRYLSKRRDEFAFVCRSYALKDLNERAGALSESYKRDIVTLKDKLKKCDDSTERTEAFLEFLKENSGKEGKVSITNEEGAISIKGKEGKARFNQLWLDSVVNMCKSWTDATDMAKYFAKFEPRLIESLTLEQARWMYYGNVCSDILGDAKLGDKLYKELKRPSGEKKFKMTLKDDLKYLRFVTRQLL